ncbi:MAG: hypothetical protein K2I78_03270 [Clostridia bacterium]|nr:hypothetical protein [Clostridia bacterium]MDE7215544.1 hypothetical protein [Clostridia bacterium]
MKIYIKTDCADIQTAKSELLKRHFSCDGYAIGYLQNGKPIIVCGQEQSGNISIAHTDKTLIMAFSDKPVGIDLERLERKISSKIGVSIEEWTQREAYGKWLGVGINKEILTAPLPNGMINTFYYGDYVVSVCSEERADEQTLIDNMIDA